MDIRPPPRQWATGVANWTIAAIASGLQQEEDVVANAMDSEVVRSAVGRIQEWKVATGQTTVPRLGLIKLYSDSEGTKPDVQKYIDILKEAAENSRDLLRLGRDVPINDDDLTSMSRVLSCAARRTVRSKAAASPKPKKSAIPSQSTPKSPPAIPASPSALPPPPLAPPNSPPHPPPIRRRQAISLSALWEEAPEGIAVNMRSVLDIESQGLTTWDQFVAWINTSFDLQRHDMALDKCFATTLPTTKGPVFERFRLDQAPLTVATWDNAICIADHEGQLLVQFSTTPVGAPRTTATQTHDVLDREDDVIYVKTHILDLPMTSNVPIKVEKRDEPPLSDLPFPDPPLPDPLENIDPDRVEDADLPKVINSDEEVEDVDDVSEPDVIMVSPPGGVIRESMDIGKEVDFEEDTRAINGVKVDFEKIPVVERDDVGNDGDATAEKEVQSSINIDWLAELMDNRAFQREDLAGAYDALGWEPGTRTPPLMRNVELLPHQIIGVRWMAEMEDGLPQGGLLADECGTGKTLTVLALLCHKIHKYELKRREKPPGYSGEAGKAQGSRIEWERHKPSLILCPKQMVLEWQSAVARFTELQPYLHYGNSSYTPDVERKIKREGTPWRYVVITTLETFHSRYYPQPGSPQFWGPGIFQRVIIDEAHRLRTSGYGVGKHINPATGKIYQIGEVEYPEKIANNVLSLGAEYKWMLTATPLVNGLADLRWVLRFLQRDSWLELNLPPDTFAHVDDLELGQWVEWQHGTDPSNSNIPGTNPKARFTPVASPYERAPAYDSLVHCTTRAWDEFVRPKYHFVQTLSRRAAGNGPGLTDHERQTLAFYQKAMGNQAYSILVSLMLRRTMVSRIPFENPRPIIDIPPMTIETMPIRYPDGTGTLAFYRELIDAPYSQLRLQISGRKLELKTGQHAFGPRWRFIRLVSLSPLLGPASMKSDMTSKDLWNVSRGMSDKGEPNVALIQKLLIWFRQAWPSIGEDRIPAAQDISKMTISELEVAMRYGAPKIAWLRSYLRQTIIDKGEKVILWVFWPLSQWFVEQYCRILGLNAFAIHSAMDTKTRSKVKQSFNHPGGIQVLICSYLTGNEGLNLHPQCRNSVLVEQGQNYAMEHQAWCRVRRIGQTREQKTTRLVNLETIDLLIENAQRIKQSPMLYAFGVMNDLSSDIDVNAEQVYDTLVGRIPPQALQKAVIGRRDNLMDID